MENKTKSVLTPVCATFSSFALPALASVVCILAVGCVAGPGLVGGAPETGTQEFPETLARPAVYLTPGDVIAVNFLYWPELDQEQEIRPDGKISLQLVGHIGVADLTVEELDQRLMELYANKIKEPEITTIVRSFGNRKAYVGGEVTNPGYVELTDQMTALEAVMSTGGFEKYGANLSDIVVIRHMDGQRYAKLLNFELPVDDPDSILILAPRDIIYVSRTRIDQVNQLVDQYINRIIPTPVWTYGLYRN